MLREVRGALKDPLYRNECRQRAGFAAALLGLVAIVPVVLLTGGVGMLCCLPLPAVLSFPTVAFPGMLVAESVLREFEGGTIEGLLLTPVDRARVMWCKFAARLKPM
ncbi:MAG: hypothetical protein ACYTGB_01905, partial [Planctomycetota bacterium]